MVVVAEHTVVDPGEMRDVDVVLDPAVDTRAPVVARDFDHPECWVCQFLERRDREQRIVLETHPDQPVLLADVVSGQPGPAWDVGPEAGRDRGADPVGPVGPAVVGAADLVAFDPAPGQRGATVDAEVGEAADRTAEPGQHELLIEQEDLSGLVGQFGAVQHRVPEMPQGLVQAHLPSDVQRVRQQLFLDLLVVDLHVRAPLYERRGAIRCCAMDKARTARASVAQT